ncbi:MAG: hypothetical protein ACRDD7_16025 [Peptostreptococcaceae bacterium]
MGLMNINIFINRIEFGIYRANNDRTKYILEDEIIIPKSFSIGERLSYIRKMISILVKEYGVRKAYMYVEEDIGVEIIEAVKVEGIIEELFSSCGVELCK